MNDISIGRISSADSLSSVLQLLKKVIMSETHVGTVAIYDHTELKYDDDRGFGIVSVRPIPLEKSQRPYMINCLILDGREFTANQLVAVLYTDLQTEGNLRQSKSDQLCINVNDYHTLMNGVIVSDNPLKIEEDGGDIKLTYNGQTYKVKKA